MKLIQNQHQNYYPELHLQNFELTQPTSTNENNESEDFDKLQLNQPLFIGRKMKFHVRNNLRKYKSIARHQIADTHYENNIEKLKRECQQLEKEEFISYRSKTDHYERRYLQQIHSNNFKNDGLANQSKINHFFMDMPNKTKYETFGKVKSTLGLSSVPKKYYGNFKIMHKRTRSESKPKKLTQQSQQDRQEIQKKDKGPKNNKKQKITIGLTGNNIIKGRFFKRKDQRTLR